MNYSISDLYLKRSEFIVFQDLSVSTPPKFAFFLFYYPLFKLRLRNMHTFKFTLLAVLSYVAMIGATPLENRAPPPPICVADPYLPTCRYCKFNPDLPECGGGPSDA
ncbi:hypothetical protein F5888DRAFT_718331 [Russula emetica]|nr:hypothetical protein F5888DRAFT_718331 [Russula emetica]